MLTAGENLMEILSFLEDGKDSYSASAVLERLSGRVIDTAAE
jgi:hypothetical protein